MYDPNKRENLKHSKYVVYLAIKSPGTFPWDYYGQQTPVAILKKGVQLSLVRNSNKMCTISTCTSETIYMGTEEKGDCLQ